MKSLTVALLLLLLGFPTLMRCLADGSINLNGILVNIVSVVTDTVTRSPSYEAPETRRTPQPQRREGDL